MPSKRTDSTATFAYHPRLALIFDFDETLASDTVGALLRHCDADPDRFHKERVQPLIDDGWEEIMARMYALVQFSHESGSPRITRETLEEVGRNLELTAGVPEFFEHVRACVREIESEIEVEFYVLTSGFIQAQRAHPIAREFKEMWGSEFHFDDSGEIVFPKQIITHPEKMRYLLQLAKGLGIEGPNSPSDVYKDVPNEDVYVPFSQMIYTGDGASDMPAFALMKDHGGIALGVVQAEEIKEWSGYASERASRQVQNLAYADFREGSELFQSLRLASESIAKLIALRKLSEGE